MKNICVLLGGVLTCSLAGCAPVAMGPKAATPVLLEEDVKVRIDKAGHSEVGAAPAAKPAVEKAP